MNPKPVTSVIECTPPSEGGDGGSAELRSAGLQPARQPVAAQILWRKGKRVAHLYRLDLARPKRPATPAQLAALAKANTVLRTCTTCRQVKDYYIPRRYGECLDCIPGGVS